MNEDSPCDDSVEPECPASNYVVAETKSDLRTIDQFDAIVVYRRREIIRLVSQDDNDEITVCALAQHIAAIENAVPIDHVPAQKRESVCRALKGHLLPHLEEMGAVTVDGDVVRPSARGERMASILDDLERPCAGCGQ